MYEIVKEGKAVIRIKKAKKISKGMEVFYNPIMKINRDITLLLLQQFPPMNLCDPLAASGIRSIRFAKELKYKSKESVLWFLSELSGYESDDIESDDFEVGCNDDQFRTVSIVDLAEDAKAIISSQTNEIATLKELLDKTIETAKFYQVSSGDRATLKFGYSRVIEEATRPKL